MGRRDDHLVGAGVVVVVDEGGDGPRFGGLVIRSVTTIPAHHDAEQQRDRLPGPANPPQHDAAWPAASSSTSRPAVLADQFASEAVDSSVRPAPCQISRGRCGSPASRGPSSAAVMPPGGSGALIASTRPVRRAVSSRMGRTRRRRPAGQAQGGCGGGRRQQRRRRRVPAARPAAPPVLPDDHQDVAVGDGVVLDQVADPEGVGHLLRRAGSCRPGSGSRWCAARCPGSCRRPRRASRA